MKKLIYIGVMACLVLTACKDTEELTDGGKVTADNMIHIGGIDTDEMVAHATITRGEGDPIDEEGVLRTDAENISWLVGPLKAGLDITYGLNANRSGTSRVAILKLLTETNGAIKYSEDGTNKYAEYSFLFRNNTDGEPTEDPAIWYGNGAHFFEGLHIPSRIEYRNEDVYDNANPPQIILPAQTLSDVNGQNGSAKNLTTDQHDDSQYSASENDLGNYTLLSHYLGMPSNYTLNATVARVKLPFRHRLARVLAYILIDPDMGDNVTIGGYNYKEETVGETTTITKDDPTTSQIRFCNVKVLAGVKDSYNSTTNHHTFTPQWKEERKVIPHFVGERGSYDDSKNQIVGNENADFIAYYDTKKKEYIYPTDAQWITIHNTKTFPDGNKTTTADETYERTKYGKVPVYDLIVQPTYTSSSRVMYDEEGYDDAATRQGLYVATNQIDFEITLSNGLQYSKRFTFDLDANYQTVVYLRISREKVDYNSSGSDRWVESTGYDGYYGVNNQNGNTLSFAGSSWQRAYTNRVSGKPTNERITDGHKYLQDNEDKYAQYVDDATWIEMFREAHQGGLHHGDYFILDHNISIPAAALPDNFVFTGHLDGMDHTITLTNAGYTKVTQRAYDDYVYYDNNEDIRYIKLADNSYQVFTPVAGVTYCSRINTGTETEPNYEYSVITNFADYDGSSAYIRTEHPPVNEGDAATYTYDDEIKFYKKVHHAEVTENVLGKEPTCLFTGLDGKYDTVQESDENAIWEANVHKENGHWVPYKTDSDGWRAEIINTNVNGGSLFGANATITGYVHNCWEGSTYNSGTHKWSGGNKVTDYTPSIPEY